MAEVSRTARVIQNAKVALFFYCINLILQFFSRKIFLDYLGAELLGLNTTAQNLLQFLNLAESGIGAAVAFALYKPLSQGNRQEIIDIVSLQGWFYRWVGLFVIAGSLVLMAFFPWIFAKTQVPLVYAYGTFIAFLISALLGYFVSYKMIVLSADQKEYKITLETQGIKVIKIFVQMLAIWKLPNGYIWWMFFEVLAAVITAIRLNHCVDTEYPWLKPEVSRGIYLKDRYPFLLVKTKQLFFHKIGGYALTQITPLVIYTFTTLTMVAIYGNYLIVMMGCLLLIDALSRGFYAGVGNLVANGNLELVKNTFLEITTIRIFLSGIVSSGLFFMTDSFMELWIGSEYKLPSEAQLILILIYFIQMSRTCEIFLSAYGLFKDIWAPIIESFLNVSLSMLLGYFWGLNGILFGVLVSQLIVVTCWKVYFLYSEVFKEGLFEYLICYVCKLFLLVVSNSFTYLIISWVDMRVDCFEVWIEKSILVISSYGILSSILFYLFDPPFRSLIKRLYVFLCENVK